MLFAAAPKNSKACLPRRLARFGAGDPGVQAQVAEQLREPQPRKVLGGLVEQVRDLMDRFNEISAQFAEPDADFDTLLAEQAKVQEQIERHDAWGLDQKVDHAMDALRLPPPVFVRLKQLAGSRMTAKGELVIAARRFRTLGMAACPRPLNIWAFTATGPDGFKGWRGSNPRRWN